MSAGEGHTRDEPADQGRGGHEFGDHEAEEPMFADRRHYETHYGH